MKIIYVHHAERNREKGVLRQEQDITLNGIKDANLLGEKLKLQSIKAIYTSPYKRCIHTANIINKYVNTSIIEDKRFNEMESGETWRELQLRNMEAIDDIIRKYDQNDIIICVTSGINLSAFVYYFTQKDASNDNPVIQGITCSPVLFSTDNSCF